MDPLAILRHEHKTILKLISELEEMTFSVSVNLRDFSTLFKNLVLFWNQHEKKEELLFKVLAENKFEIPIDEIEFEHGELREMRQIIMKAIHNGEDDRIKEVINDICTILIDRLKSHTYAEEIILDKIKWENLDKNTIEKIELLQIIGNKKILDDK